MKGGYPSPYRKGRLGGVMNLSADCVPDESKIVLEDINQKFDLLVKGHSGLNNKFDQLDHEIDGEIEDRQTADVILLKEIRDLRTDLNEHRNSTEIHGERKKRKTS